MNTHKKMIIYRSPYSFKVQDAMSYRTAALGTVMAALCNALSLTLVITQGVLSKCPPNDWARITLNEICAVPGSSVVIPCTLTPPAGHTVTKVFWLINPVEGVEPNDIAQNPSYTGRVEYYWNEKSNKNNCTLKLTNVKMSDSTRYNARIITQKDKWHSCTTVYLSVTDLTVWVPEPVVEGREVKLSCKHTCNQNRNPPVIWRKNGKDLTVKQTHNSELLLQRVSAEDEGDYSCALKGHEGHPSKPVKLNIMFPPRNTTVSIRPDVMVTQGSSVTLTCSSDANPPVENYTWFKVNESTPVGSGQQYNITDISSEDGGQYYCEARNKYGAENSTAVSITVCSVSSTVTGDHASVVLYLTAGVSVCGAAGLLCVLVWIRSVCLTHHKRNTSTPRCDSRKMDMDPHVDVDYENEECRKPGDMQMNSVYQSLNPNTTQPDAVYQSLNPNTIQPDPVYQSLNPNTAQPDPVYQRLNPNTTQPDAV